MEKASILLVEDDPQIAEVVKETLEAEHYAVNWAKTALQGKGLLDKLKPQLVILDRNLPDKDGLEFCRELRAQPENAGVMVLFLTARKTMTEKVIGLRMGGDDYLTKPFGAEELIARVEALLRRAKGAPETPGFLTAGPIQLNVEGRIAKIDGKEVALTKKEFDLLRVFLERPERVLSRSFLLTHVWGYDVDVEISTKAVNVMIMGLRRKLGPHAESIEAVKEMGYRFRPPEA